MRGTYPFTLSPGLPALSASAEGSNAGLSAIDRQLIRILQQDGRKSFAAAPFGGMKQSGLGREGGREGLREFQETQYLSLGWPQ